MSFGAILLLGAALVASPGARAGGVPAICQDRDVPSQDRAMACMAALDLDGDGALSPREAGVLPRLSGRFAELDGDGNGVLSPGEFQGDGVSPAERAGAIGD
ncbi:MAG: hypothetical protein PVF91_13615 [Chromatiales bacterium]|jgi:hypothetical protein